MKFHLFGIISCRNHDVSVPEAMFLDFMGGNWENSYNF